MPLPSGLGALAVRTARLLPDSVLAAVVPSRFEFGPADRFSPPDPEMKPVRLYIGPVNFAGQAWHWARAVERERPDVAAVCMAYSAGPFRSPVDDLVPGSVSLMSKRWQDRQRQAVAERFTHVIVE